MKRKIKYLIGIVSFSLFVIPIFTMNTVFCGSNSSDITTAPRLACPINPEVTITGDTLEFKWWPGNIGVNAYQFTLYKGGGSSGDILVSKKLPFGVDFIKVDTKLFENGKTYTWTLRQQASDGIWGDSSFNTFKVNK